ncbi:hypothetical protein Hanom_Chr12g01080791 [Helianthus anomalus]
MALDGCSGVVAAKGVTAWQTPSSTFCRLVEINGAGRARRCGKSACERGRE